MFRKILSKQLMLIAGYVQCIDDDGVGNKSRDSKHRSKCGGSNVAVGSYEMSVLGFVYGQTKRSVVKK